MFLYHLTVIQNLVFSPFSTISALFLRRILFVSFFLYDARHVRSGILIRSISALILVESIIIVCFYRIVVAFKIGYDIVVAEGG